MYVRILDMLQLRKKLQSHVRGGGQPPSALQMPLVKVFHSLKSRMHLSYQPISEPSINDLVNSNSECMLPSQRHVSTRLFVAL